MALHDSLRELVAARGAAVVDDATELRGALDDFLGEDEATIGELNLLVDAVRLGGLDRLLTMLDNGAAPAAAVAEAGAALARDRGSDDTRRASWAVAALGFALGRVDAGVVERTVPTAGPVTPPPPPPPPPVPDPIPEPAPDPLPGQGTLGSAEAVPTAFDRERSVPMSPPPVAPVARRKRRSVVLLSVSFAVVLGLVGGIGLALWLERDTSTNANDPGVTPSASDSATDSTEDDPATIPKTDILVTYISEEERVDRVDVNGGPFKRLTKGPQDHLPSISPDRTQVAYLVGASEEPRILMIQDVGAGPPRDVFGGEGPCAHSLRPGWSLNGAWLALICTGVDDESDGLYLANPVNGATYELKTDLVPLNGSPTWVDGNTIVYTQTDEDGRTTLWSLDIDLGSNRADGAPVQLIHQEDPAAGLSHPDWSEEAGKLLYLVHTDEDGGLGELWISDEKLDGAEALGGPFGHPVWSPDGDAIAFTVEVSEGADAVEKLAVADFDGEKLLPEDVLEEVPEGEVGIPVWGSR